MVVFSPVTTTMTASSVTLTQDTEPFPVFPSDLRCELGRRRYAKTNPHIDNYVKAINAELFKLLDTDSDLLSKLDSGSILTLEIPLLIVEEDVGDEVLTRVGEKFSDCNWDFSWSVRVKTVGTLPDGTGTVSTPYLSVKLSSQE